MKLPSGARLFWFNFSLFIEFTQRGGQIQLLDPGGHGRHLGGCVQSEVTADNQSVLNTSSEHLWKMLVREK